MNTKEQVLEPVSNLDAYRDKARSKRRPVDIVESQDHYASYGSGGGGGNDLEKRISRIEAIIEDIRDDLKDIKTGIQSSEQRLVTKISDDNKWIVSLIISSILIPLLIALVTK